MADGVPRETSLGGAGSSAANSRTRFRTAAQSPPNDTARSSMYATAGGFVLVTPDTNGVSPCAASHGHTSAAFRAVRTTTR